MVGVTEKFAAPIVAAPLFIFVVKIMTGLASAGPFFDRARPGLRPARARPRAIRARAAPLGAAAPPDLLHLAAPSMAVRGC